MPTKRRAAAKAILITVAFVLTGVVLLAAGCGARVSGPIPLRLVGSRELDAPPGERIQELAFQDPQGREVTGVLRQPADSGRARAGVVLVAGRETGRQAAAVIRGPLEQVVLAIEYPAALPETFAPGEVMREIGRVRASALRMPGLLRGAARWLAGLDAVDSTRIVLVGVSYGVPFAAAAAPDPLFRGVALHHGGAGLVLLLEHNLAVENTALRWLLARLGAWYFRALEPARYVGSIAPRPLLLVNAERDELVPRASAERLLAAARRPVRQVWIPHGHLMPSDTVQMKELADSTLSYFEFLSGSGP
jgi:hypothetical protein